MDYSEEIKEIIIKGDNEKLKRLFNNENFIKYIDENPEWVIIGSSMATERFNIEGCEIFYKYALNDKKVTEDTMYERYEKILLCEKYDLAEKLIYLVDGNKRDGYYIMITAKAGKVNLLKKLLYKDGKEVRGSGIEKGINEGFIEACKYNNIDCIIYLLERGVEKEDLKYKVCPRTKYIFDNYEYYKGENMSIEDKKINLLCDYILGSEMKREFKDMNEKMYRVLEKCLVNHDELTFLELYDKRYKLDDENLLGKAFDYGCCKCIDKLIDTMSDKVDVNNELNNYDEENYENYESSIDDETFKIIKERGEFNKKFNNAGFVKTTLE